jgi:GNAT superfamily N-acetyltransferase
MRGDSQAATEQVGGITVADLEFHVEDDPDPLDLEVLEAGIRRAASAATGLGGQVELAIFVREAGKVVAGISGWTWGDCCELENLWVEPRLRGRWLGSRLLAAAEAEAAARGCSQTVHFTYDFQARRLYERAGYELVGRVEDFPSGADVLWYRKRLNRARLPVAGTGGRPSAQAR